MANLPGTVIAAQITTGDTANTFSIGDTNLMQGGHHTVQTLVNRDEISAARRHDGMTCWVRDLGVMYQLVGGTLNTDWKPAPTTLTQAAGSFAGSILYPDLAGPAYQLYTVNGNVDIQLGNAAVDSPAVRSVTARIIATGTGTYSLNFLDNSTWVGNGEPGQIVGAQHVLINFTSLGTTSADVYAAYTST